MLAQYVGGDQSVLSGLMVGADNIRGRAFAMDIPQAFNGNGRVIMSDYGEAFPSLTIDTLYASGALIIAGAGLYGYFRLPPSSLSVPVGRPPVDIPAQPNPLEPVQIVEA